MWSFPGCFLATFKKKKKLGEHNLHFLLFHESEKHIRATDANLRVSALKCRSCALFSSQAGSTSPERQRGCHDDPVAPDVRVWRSGDPWCLNRATAAKFGSVSLLFPGSRNIIASILPIFFNNLILNLSPEHKTSSSVQEKHLKHEKKMYSCRFCNCYLKLWINLFYSG